MGILLFEERLKKKEKISDKATVYLIDGFRITFRIHSQSNDELLHFRVIFLVLYIYIYIDSTIRFLFSGLSEFGGIKFQVTEAINSVCTYTENFARPGLCTHPKRGRIQLNETCLYSL